MTLLLPAPRTRSSSHGERSEPIVTAPPGAQVNVEVEIPEDGNDATFRISVKLAKVEPGKTAVVIPLPSKAPRIDAGSAKPLQPRAKKGRELLGAIALFMVLMGSSMLAVGLVAVLLFR